MATRTPPKPPEPKPAKQAPEVEDDELTPTEALAEALEAIREWVRKAEIALDEIEDEAEEE